MEKKDPTLINAVFDQWFDNEPEMHERYLNICARETLINVIGSMSAYVRRVSVVDGVMHIYVTSAALKQKLSASKKWLIREVNGKISAELIREVFVY